MKIVLAQRFAPAMILLVGHALLVTAAQPAGSEDAVAVWHFQNLDDSAGANSALNPQGSVEVGQPCDDAAKAASLARGGN